MWAQKNLDTVQKIRFGNEPLLQEIMTLEESLKSSKQKFVEMKKQFEEAREKLEKTILEYDSVADAKNNKARDYVSWQRHTNLEMDMMVNLVSICFLGTSLASSLSSVKIFSSKITKQWLL